MNQVILAKQTNEDAQFNRISKLYQVRIPNDIISFLQQNSRGIPKEKSLKGVEDLFISSFVSVSEKDKVNIFSLTQLCNEDSTGRVLVPIALDGFGGLFCLKFINLDMDGIVYVSEDSSGEIPVCKDFDDFLRKLNLK